MDAEGVERVVVAQLPLEKRHGEVAHGRHDEAHDHRGPRLHEARRRRDHHEARHQTGRRAHERGLACAHALDEHPGHERRARRRHRVRQRERRHAVGGELGARVEAEPSEPQKRRAQRHERHVVGTVAHHAEPAPLARDQAENEPREAGRDVHHVAAREVERANGVAHEAAFAAPHHVSERRVHHDGPYGHERAHRAELHATGHRAGDDGRGDHAERQLEHHVGHRGIRVVTQRFGRLAHDAGHKSLQADLIEAPEERNRAVAAVGERPAAHRPCDADDADHRKRHDHRVHDVLAAAQTPVEERQAGRHQQDEHRANQHEARRPCVKHMHLPPWKSRVASVTLR